MSGSFRPEDDRLPGLTRPGPWADVFEQPSRLILMPSEDLVNFSDAECEGALGVSAIRTREGGRRALKAGPGGCSGQQQFQIFALQMSEADGVG